MVFTLLSMKVVSGCVRTEPRKTMLHDVAVNNDCSRLLPVIATLVGGDHRYTVRAIIVRHCQSIGFALAGWGSLFD